MFIRKMLADFIIIYMYFVGIRTVKYIVNEQIQTRPSDKHYEAQTMSNLISESCIGIVTKPTRVANNHIEAE